MRKTPASFGAFIVAHCVRSSIPKNLQDNQRSHTAGFIISTPEKHLDETGGKQTPNDFNNETPPPVLSGGLSLIDSPSSIPSQVNTSCSLVYLKTVSYLNTSSGSEGDQWPRPLWQRAVEVASAGCQLIELIHFPRLHWWLHLSSVLLIPLQF